MRERSAYMGAEIYLHFAQPQINFKHMKKLSVIIPTFNEAHNIAAVLQTVQWADEVIVIDSFSTDQTTAIAETFGAKVIQRKYIGPAEQKNWAIPKASHEWILILDADERITPALQKEIQGWLHKDIPFDAFWIGRQNFFMAQKIKYSGWQGDAVIRFMHRDRCRYNNKQVHEEIETENIKLGRLKNKMLHYTFKNSDHFLEKMQRYAAWSAQDYFEKTPHVTYFHLLIKPLFRFFKHFVLQRGFLDGKVGLIISVIMAWSVFLRYVKIKEMRQSQKA